MGGTGRSSWARRVDQRPYRRPTPRNSVETYLESRRLTVMHTRTWRIDVLLTEGEGHTRALAVLQTDAGTRLEHEGHARLNPDDPDVPEIGDELATCRALHGLAQDLFEASVMDVAANAGSATATLDL